jgi:hypothetical protein
VHNALHGHSGDFLGRNNCKPLGRGALVPEELVPRIYSVQLTRTQQPCRSRAAALMRRQHGLKVVIDDPVIGAYSGFSRDAIAVQRHGLATTHRRGAAGR